MSKRLRCRVGLHDYKPTPQTLGDFIWGFRTWVCSCGAHQTRRETEHDDVKDVMNRFIG